VVHGGANDVLWLQRDAHLYLVNLLDTEKAAQARPGPLGGGGREGDEWGGGRGAPGADPMTVSVFSPRNSHCSPWWFLLSHNDGVLDDVRNITLECLVRADHVVLSD
jgi:hypothetical protein